MNLFYKQVKSGKQNKKKDMLYIYCCIINNAPSEQNLAGFLICHLQVLDTFFYSYSPKRLQPFKLKSRQLFRTSLQNTKYDLHKKSKALIRSCTALVLSTLYLHFHQSFDVRLQCFMTGPLKLVLPASFHKCFQSKKIQHKSTLCGLWITTRNYYEVYLPQLRKTVLGLWLVLSHCEDMLYKYSRDRVMTESITSKMRSVVFQFLPAFQTSYILNKDKFPLLTIPLWKGTLLKRTTIMYHTTTYACLKKSWTCFHIQLTFPKDKIYTARCHDTFTKVLKFFSPSVSLLKKQR